MKNKIFIVSFIFLGIFSYADDKTIEIDGKTIILHDDYTWNYIDKIQDIKSEKLILNYDSTNTIVLKSKNDKYCIHIDNEKWIQTKGLNDNASFQFVNKSDTGYGILIYEGLSIPLKSLKEALIINASNLDPNAKITNVEECIVNNKDGELVTYVANSAGLEFVFYTFITTSENGTIQFTFYTLANEFEKLKPSFQEAISGLEFN